MAGLRDKHWGKRSLIGAGLLFLCAMGEGGCVSPVAMHQAVLAYDRSVERITSEELLLNIVRARFYQPVHFTKVSSIAATFDFRVSAGIAPPEGEARGLVGPVFSATAAENPTVTIIPIDGAEFTTRLLTPLDETRFLKLLDIGANMGMALAMVASSLQVERDGGSIVYMNDPTKPEEYEEFRRRVLHLAMLNDAHHLHIDPVMSEEVWVGDLPKGITPADVLAAMDKGYTWTRVGEGTRYRLSRLRVLISNYRPAEVPESMLRELAERLKEWPPNDILVDVRPGYPGGESPLTGQITLRSFNSVLEFLARVGDEYPEPGAERVHDRAGSFLQARRILKIEESDGPIDQAAVSVRYGGRYYGIRRPIDGDADAIWNIKVFGMLYQLFQMMVQPIAAPVPGIAIAK